jgi:hypothetical protein
MINGDRSWSTDDQDQARQTARTVCSVSASAFTESQHLIQKVQDYAHSLRH